MYHCFSTIFNSLSEHENIIAPTLDDVRDSWARVVCRDGFAHMNLAESRQHVVRFISRETFVEPVDLQMIVVFVWDSLESSLRTFHVL